MGTIHLYMYVTSRDAITFQDAGEIKLSGRLSEPLSLKKCTLACGTIPGPRAPGISSLHEAGHCGASN